MEIKELEPKALWSRFAEICAIPHPSKHEEAILAYLKKFADDRGLQWSQDKTGNLVVRKPATAGKENAPTVVLQSHVDMVPQKNSDTAFDFTKDPIRPYVDGEWVTADKTTLGADNGIGCAAMLAILDSKNLPHPAIEALFTVDEETGLVGAFGLDEQLLNGSILINLDSEDEGELYVGCAGAVNNTAAVPYAVEPTPGGTISYAVELRGLKGGHSGLEIILQRANANKIMTRFLREQAVNEVRLSWLDGGSLRNAIPREASAVVVVPTAHKEAFEKAAKAFEAQIKMEYKAVETSISFEVTGVSKPAVVIAAADQKRLLDALTAAPNGIYRMSDAMKGLVETSTNMAKVETKNGVMSVLFMTRCMVNYGKREVVAQIHAAFEAAGGTVVDENDYDGWAPNMQSELLATMKKGYTELYGTEPAVKAIHAGLECGIIGSKYPEMDMISIGPTMRFPHSPDEKVNIATVGKFYEFLTHTLAKL